MQIACNAMLHRFSEHFYCPQFLFINTPEHLCKDSFLYKPTFGITIQWGGPANRLQCFNSNLFIVIDRLLDLIVLASLAFSGDQLTYFFVASGSMTHSPVQPLSLSGKSHQGHGGGGSQEAPAVVNRGQILGE